MNIITYIMIAFAILAAIDRIIGNKIGIGEELEKGIEMIGILTLAMAGMLIMTPLIAEGLNRISVVFPKFFDFSIIPACLLSSDSGGAHLALSVANDKQMGYFNGLVVASMMGCTVSTAIPFALQITKREIHKEVLFGTICGIITIPVGCIIAGIMMGINLVILIKNLIPLIVFSVISTFGLLKFEEITIKLFKGLGIALKAVITIGLLVGIIEYLTGKALLPYIDSLENAVDIIINIMCIIAGAFPLIYLLKKIFKTPLKKMGELMKINETSAFGFLFTTATFITTFEMMNEMDKKGIVLNSAFAVSASFVFVDHMAFTMSFKPEYTLCVIVAKLISGITAIFLANIVLKRKNH